MTETSGIKRQRRKAKALANPDALLVLLEKINRNQLLSHKLERKILKALGDSDFECGQNSEADARRSGEPRQSMVRLTAMKIISSPLSAENAIKNHMFVAFKSIPGAYDKYASFCKAVDRRIRTHLR